MLQRCMIRAKCAIDRRLSPRMSKVHPWMVIFDLPMAQEVFNILHKDVLGPTRYGWEVEEKPGSVTITFFSLRRLCHLFDKFMDCGGFIKQLGEGKGQVKLIVSQEKKRSDDLQCKSRVFASKILLWLLEFVWYQPTLNTEITSLFWKPTMLNCCVEWCELHKEKTPVKQGNSKTLSNSSIHSGCYNASTWSYKLK